MKLTPQAQAILLLTTTFGKSDGSGAKPLSNSEWGRFANRLRAHDLDPANLVGGDLEAQLGGLDDRTLSMARIQSLLGRGAALGFALEKWERAGLWVLTRADREYPERLKRRLRALSPPVLFGCGKRALLNIGGLAVVGSRDASDADLAVTRHLGEKAASQGLSIVSGGARGVDEAAMAAALAGEGTGIGVLADSLLRSATSSRYRGALLTGDLVLITPFNPEAGFSVGNAMARNKYIYCLADAAVIISSTPNKGGTWNGAVEALKHEWVPVWVNRSEASKAGNTMLVGNGARWLPDDLDSMSSLFEPAGLSAHDDLQLRGRDEQREDEQAAQDVVSLSAERPTELHVQRAEAVPSSNIDSDPYETFLARLGALAGEQALSAAQIAEQLDLKKANVRDLLKKGLDEGKLKKLAKPVRYKLTHASINQPSLFGNDL